MPRAITWLERVRFGRVSMATCGPVPGTSGTGPGTWRILVRLSPPGALLPSGALRLGGAARGGASGKS
ncbi:MAG TPA: hypothetical protein VNV62_18410 [Trebonia sp.]|nr:hypothetical protein [Trebonia sp.]